MGFVLREPKRLTPAKRNSIRVTFKVVKNRKSIEMLFYEDVVANFLPKDTKKIKLFVDSDDSRRLFLMPATKEDEKAYSLMTMPKTNHRKMTFAWNGHMPSLLGSYFPKFEKSIHSSAQGILITLPD